MEKEYIYIISRKRRGRYHEIFYVTTSYEEILSVYMDKFDDDLITDQSTYFVHMIYKIPMGKYFSNEKGIGDMSIGQKSKIYFKNMGELREEYNKIVREGNLNKILGQEE